MNKRVREDILALLRQKPLTQRDISALVSGTRNEVASVLTGLRNLGLIKRSQLPPPIYPPKWILCSPRDKEAIMAETPCEACKVICVEPFSRVYEDPPPRPPNRPRYWQVCRDCVAAMIMLDIAYEREGKIWAVSVPMPSFKTEDDLPFVPGTSLHGDD